MTLQHNTDRLKQIDSVCSRQVDPAGPRPRPFALSHCGPAQRLGCGLIQLCCVVFISPLLHPQETQVYIYWQLRLRSFIFGPLCPNGQLSRMLECVSLCNLTQIMWQSLWFSLIPCKDFSLSKLIYFIFIFFSSFVLSAAGAQCCLSLVYIQQTGPNPVFWRLMVL